MLRLLQAKQGFFIAMKTLETLCSVAAAQFRLLRSVWNTATADIIGILLMSWCTFVLVSNPDYLTTTARLADLHEQFPAYVWAALFGFGAAYQSVCLLFGSESCPCGVRNPLMATNRQKGIWQIARMSGWFFGMSLSFFVVILISKHGYQNFGTGFFGLNALCSLIAFSGPLRMFCADLVARTLKRRAIQQVRQAKQTARSFTAPPAPR